jgi:hypothetical protein
MFNQRSKAMLNEPTPLQQYGNGQSAASQYSNAVPSTPIQNKPGTAIEVMLRALCVVHQSLSHNNERLHKICERTFGPPPEGLGQQNQAQKLTGGGIISDINMQIETITSIANVQRDLISQLEIIL